MRKIYTLLLSLLFLMASCHNPSRYVVISPTLNEANLRGGTEGEIQWYVDFNLSDVSTWKYLVEYEGYKIDLSNETALKMLTRLIGEDIFIISNNQLCIRRAFLSKFKDQSIKIYIYGYDKNDIYICSGELSSLGYKELLQTIEVSLNESRGGNGAIAIVPSTTLETFEYKSYSSSASVLENIYNSSNSHPNWKFSFSIGDDSVDKVKFGVKSIEAFSNLKPGNFDLNVKIDYGNATGVYSYSSIPVYGNLTTYVFGVIDDARVKKTEKELEDLNLTMIKVEKGSTKNNSYSSDHDFYISSTEITQKQFETITGRNNFYPIGGIGGILIEDSYDYPANGKSVNWYATLAFCNKLSILQGLEPCYTIKTSTDPEDWGDVPEESDSNWDAVVFDSTKNGYRLPTKAEWLYAAVGGNGAEETKYSGSNNVSDVAWYKDNAGDMPHKVAQKKANALGIYDMTGNLFEWVFDGEEGSNYRYSCGGSYQTDENGSVINNYYTYEPPTYNSNLRGFRIVRN